MSLDRKTNILALDFLQLVRKLGKGSYVDCAREMPDVNIDEPVILFVIHLIHPFVFRHVWPEIASLMAPHMTYDESRECLCFDNVEDAIRGCDAFYTCVYYKFGMYRHLVANQMEMFASAVKTIDGHAYTDVCQRIAAIKCT